MEINGELHALNRAPSTQLRLDGPQICSGCFVEQKTLASGGVALLKTIRIGKTQALWGNES